MWDSLWARAKRRQDASKSPQPQDDPLATVHWVAAADNPFGVELLNCSAFSQTMRAVTQDSTVADSYAALRRSDGAQYRASMPDGPRTHECSLHYPHQGESRDGPIFKAQTMEEKWDIYLYDGYLYFTRSWTGALEYRAAIEISPAAARVVAVTARQELFEEDDRYPIAAVDFLIRSHLYGWAVPHPLPKSLGRDTRKLGLFSFSQYGSRALYGTFADTTQLQPPPRPD
jgi:hypothetical protein